MSRARVVAWLTGRHAPQQGCAVLVAPGGETGGVKRGEVDSAQLGYDAPPDEVVCPQARRLQFAGRKAKGKGKPPVRGLDNVRTHWALLCTASNLWKLYQHWAVQRVPAQPLPAREPGRRESPARGAQRGGSSPRQTQKENSRALPGCSPLTAAPGRI